MLNEVHVEGLVTKKIWKYGGDTFFRMAIYRDQDRRRKPAYRDNPNERDHPDYLTIRIPASMTALPVDFKARMRIQVHGWIESREFTFTLEEFLEKAEGPSIRVAAQKAKDLKSRRGSTWLVADRVVTLNGASNRGGKRK